MNLDLEVPETIFMYLRGSTQRFLGTQNGNCNFADKKNTLKRGKGKYSIVQKSLK